jgi:hypothetical protein
MGTPGVGKSYTSALVGLALKWSGFLTIGDIKEIKKPDIVGSYTGQTAPKVYNELTQALGKVIFIDEAYSIAGPRDETKKSFNEFGQEALDAITDYTSEHIGLFAFIVAGYEYEMRNQFLNVNIGLPRRFPTILILRRYDLKSFWKILESPLKTFTPKYQANHHHHACFELLNLMFNYQCAPNPSIRLSKNWKELWEGYRINNLIINLQISMDYNDINNFQKIPIMRLTNLNQKLETIQETQINSESVDILPYSIFFAKVQSVTSTFIKSYFIYKFTQILNGDFFRSQADNLTKFGQIILEDEIINPSGLFQPNENKNEKGNIPWIEYLYFKLYFKKNPNKNISNVDYSFVEPSKIGGTKTHHSKNHTVKKIYKKNKNTKKLNTKMNKTKQMKKTKQNRKYKKLYKKTKRYKGGAKDSNGNEIDESENNDDDETQALASQMASINLNGENSPVSPPVPEEQPNLEELNEMNEADKASKINEQIDKTNKLRPQIKQELDDYFKKNLGKIDKDLEFNIVGIDFSYLRDTQSLVDEIIFLYINDNDINDSEKESLKKELNSSFAIFLENYNKYLKIFESNEEFQLDNDFINFIYVYILLSAYKTALIESKQELSAFKVTSWWFFTQGDFIDIKNDLDLKYILQKYNEMLSTKIEPSLIQERVPEPPVEPSVEPSVEREEVQQDLPSEQEKKVPSLSELKKLVDLGSASPEEVLAYKNNRGNLANATPEELSDFRRKKSEG